MRIRRVGVVGAGTMGAGIAALAASAGVPVVLLDVPAKEGDPSAPAKKGLERQLKARPAAFMDVERAALVRTGNTRDDLGLLADCDLVIEAIIEQLEPKRELYARLEKVLPKHAIVASNTSGIPMQQLVEGRSDSFRKRFLGLHFFNPPRYLHLLEIIRAPETSDETLTVAREYAERIFGKGTIIARDVPGFVANRLGVYGMVLALRMLDEFGLTIDEVDAITGPALARAKSATFRTADLTGLDVLDHVASELTRATGEDFALPDWVKSLIAKGQLGEKSGAGFYRKQGKEIQTLDRKSLEYAAQQKVDSKELGRLSKLPLPERFAAIRDLPGKYGDFARLYLLRLSHFVLERTPQIAYDLPSVDRAMEWGYAWEAGPFKQMDMLGLDFLREGFRKHGLSEPALLASAGRGFYSENGASVLQVDGKRASVPPINGAISLESLAARGRILEQNDDARLVDLGDGVACLEFRSKMNTLGAGVLDALRRSLDRAERDGLQGLVLGNEDPRTFTAGADLAMVGALVQKGDWKTLDKAVRDFQGLSMAIRGAPFPVVAAPFGLTLGGGCEFSLHADAIQAHAELYMGLVEVGVGLLPGGGGTKELLFRFTTELASYEEPDYFEAVRRAFKLIAMGTTSTSALEARKLGFLRQGDGISMNRDLLIADAKRKVVALAPGYVAPVPRTITATGSEGLGNLNYAAWAMREAGQITDYEVKLAGEIAYVLTGGDGPPRPVTEQEILDLERDAFLRLLGTKQTQERMEHMLKTGKPLRN
ncbi:MAG TPA: 3-hydroxyacyl-CoA dehydrogenase/enoyl-CoA hydratase family protein [Gemmatimonadaceae bacterium]|nr:3-hydroxyacyl-CoA dehydrogenase/enoyl-CoA hydratase family protein [Gemmatimonadaceae bacterium]